MHPVEQRLPESLLGRASLRGSEYAWPVTDIPEVIEAARRADLVSVGGQLQFRFPDNSIAECYWVEVDASKVVPEAMPWPDRVEQSAHAALDAFEQLASRYDFLAEGRSSFPEVFRKLEAAGHDPRNAMCFVWYVTGPDEGALH